MMEVCGVGLVYIMVLSGGQMGEQCPCTLTLPIACQVASGPPGGWGPVDKLP